MPQVILHILMPRHYGRLEFRRDMCITHSSLKERAIQPVKGLGHVHTHLDASKDGASWNTALAAIIQGQLTTLKGAAHEIAVTKSTVNGLTSRSLTNVSKLRPCLHILHDEWHDSIPHSSKHTFPIYVLETDGP